MKLKDKKETKEKKIIFKYIESKKDLLEACRVIAKEESFAIDLESENGLHLYGTYICLIQSSTPSKHFIIDTLNFKDRISLEPFIKILEDESIEKVLHDYSFDLRILYTQYQCRPKNIFDTQIACLLLGKEKLGLASLLEHYCQITAEKKFQRYDWTRRPLPQKMLEYAIGDTNSLLLIRDKLKAELIEKNRLSWHKQECSEIENKELSYTEQSFYDIKGIRSLSNQERATLLKLWTLRDDVAKKYDKPLHYVMSTKIMLEISKNPPKTNQSWSKVNRISRFVKNNLDLFNSAIQSSKNQEIMLPQKEKKRLSKEDKLYYKSIENKRNKIAQKLKIRSHLIANNDQLLEITLSKKFDCLRPWQIELLN